MRTGEERSTKMANNLYNQKSWLDKFIPTESMGAYESERVEEIVASIPEDVKSILDIGVGGGYLYQKVKERIGTGYTGIDISFELVKRAKDEKVCVADVKNLPFKDKQFDLVLAADVLEHLKEDVFTKSIEEIIRVSKKYILINSPYNDSINWPVSKCDKCGNEFNVYGHLRKVSDGLLATLFPETCFKILMKKVVGLRRDIRPGFLVFLARKFGKVYSEEGGTCPHCFNFPIKKHYRNIFEACVGKMMCGIFFLMDRLIPPGLKKKSEICILIEKRKIV